MQNFLGREHLESTKIRHFNPKILKKNFCGGGTAPSQAPPLCVCTMQCSKKTEGRFGGKLKGEVEYYYCSAFLIHL